MTALKLDKFGGEIPAWDPRLLPDGQASLSVNCYLFSGSLIGWRQPKLLYALKDSTAQYVFRIPNKDTNDTSITASDSFWMEFTDPDTLVLRGPVVDDSFQRYYWSSPSQPPMYNTYDRILAGDHPWLLGVPASGCTPGVTVDGGGDTAQVGNVTVLPDAGGSDYQNANSIFLTPIVPQGSMLVESVSFIPASSDGALNFQAVVYSDLNGLPSELLGTGSQVTGVTSGVEASSTFLNGISVISDVTYWVGIAHDDPVYVTVADTRVNNGATISNTYSNGPPAFATAAGNGPVWNMWGNLLGSSVFTARSYVYSWVSAYGEEGPPSPPAVVNGWSNATWTVDLFQPPPENMGVDLVETMTGSLWPPVNAKIAIDFINNRAWTEADGEVAIDTLLGSDPNTENGWSTTFYDPAYLTADGYFSSDVRLITAFIGGARTKIFNGCTIVLRLKDPTSVTPKTTFGMVSEDGNQGLEIDLIGGLDISNNVNANSWNGTLDLTIVGMVNNLTAGAINVLVFTVTAARLDFAINGSTAVTAALTIDDYPVDGDGALVAALIDQQQNRDALQSITIYDPLPDTTGLSELSDIFVPPSEVTIPAVRNITTTRLYRSISNQAGQGTYFLVAEFPVTQATYVDALSDDVVAFNSQLQSLNWFEPPSDLQGFKSFPNGILVGWKANEVWFSEPYRPHAWPPSYVLTTEFPVVGIGVAGQSIIVCTQGSPYMITGVNPSSMSLTKINLPEPCIHRGSIISTDTTVLYVSQNGLVQISSTGAGANITESWISREKWQALTPQAHVRAIKHATSYFAFGGEPIRDGFTVELSTQDQTSFTIWPQAGGHRLGFSQLTSPNNYDIDNVLVDAWTGVGLLVQNEGVWYYDFTDQEPVIVPYKWRSKIYQQLSAKNFEAVKVWFTVPPGTAPQVDRNTNDPQAALGDNQYGIVRVYADDELWTTRELRKSGELLRIYSGIKVEAWQFEIEGRVNISNLQVATSVKELGLI